MADKVITSGKVIQKPEIVLETDDFLPPGLIGVRTKRPDELNLSDSSADSTSAGTITDGEETGGGEGPPSTGGDFGQLPVPSTMRVISQVMRVGADGKVTIDVVIETDDFPGIQEFEARVVRDS